MFKKLKNMIVVAAASLALFAPAVAAVTISTASANNITGNICSGVNQAASNSTSQDCGSAGTGGNTDLSSIASKVVNLFSIVVGIVAVIMIIYGGFRYITSGGESSNVGNAKNTIIFAIVGLIIVALAQFIVHFVLNTTTNTGITNQ